jgi:hypothetical protein
LLGANHDPAAIAARMLALYRRVLTARKVR